jgi:serine/threonine-protein kinase BUR1
MVFPYMDHDLAGLLENERVKLSPSQIKLYMKQILEGTEYMHRVRSLSLLPESKVQSLFVQNHILHRDMKAANLLISNNGSLKIADFGLARAFDPNIVRDMALVLPEKQRKYTNCVVTRWYRPPELLLGARQYGGEVDIWGIGLVIRHTHDHTDLCMFTMADVFLVRCFGVNLSYLDPPIWISLTRFGNCVDRPRS